jgi:DNA-binding beta-propeller fold protein YncE
METRWLSDARTSISRVKYLPRGIMIKKLMFLIIIFMTIPLSCTRENPSSPSATPRNVILTHRLFVIPENDSISTYDMSDSVITIKFVGPSPDITTGSIIVSAKEEGYLREVETADYQNGFLQLVTIPTYMTDVIRNGIIDDSVLVGIESAAVKYRFFNNSIHLVNNGIDIGNITLFSGEHNGGEANISIAEGYLDFNPALLIHSLIAGNDLYTFQSVLEGAMEMSSLLDIDVTGEVDISRELPLASFKKFSITSVGKLPVPATVCLDFRIGFELHTTGSGRWQILLQDESNTNFGMKYRNGSWKQIGGIQRQQADISANCESSSDISLQYYLKSAICVSLYSVKVSSYQLNQNFTFTGETNYPPVTEWLLTGTWDAETDFCPSIMDQWHSYYKIHLSDSNGYLAQGPYSTDYFIHVKNWGEQGSNCGQFNHPSGIDVDASDNVYVCDTENHRIQKFSSDGEYLLSFGSRGSEPGDFNFPCDMAIGSDGAIYVVDNGNKRIQKFAPDTTLLTWWGKEGNGEGEFNSPSGIALDGEGYVYVTDYHNHNVQKFSESGVFISEWGDYGDGPGELNCPSGITFGPGDTIYITECHNNRVQKFSPDGTFLRMWGNSGEEDSQFTCPIDIAADTEGGVYVLDNGNSRMQKFDSRGNLITILGSLGTSDGKFDSPEGLALNGSGYLFISDTRNNRIQKFIIK